VIATKASPLEGLLGDASIHINPIEAEISRALDEVLSSSELRTRMSERGLAAARRLTWDYAGRQMMDVIGKVTGR
jgi:glycosyltransferase involved in cell wall biosynthesis